MRAFTIKNNLAKAGILLFWLLVWQAAAAAVGQSLLLPTPGQVFLRLLALCRTGAFWQAVAGSLAKVFAGFLLAVTLGTLLAAVTSAHRLLYAFVAPVMSILKSTPVASFTILALVWVRAADLSVLIAFIMVIPLVYFNVYTGITGVDKALLEMARVFRLSLPRVIRQIYVPLVMPQLIAAASAGIGFAWKSGIAAEVIGLAGGTIGIHLYNAKIYLETPALFAWTIVVILISFLMEKAVVGILTSFKGRKAAS